ncbi:MAG TPA: VWA domain-containing protein [Pyrinomonadaceae bacterium]|jgi:VWFA-related protein
MICFQSPVKIFSSPCGRAATLLLIIAFCFSADARAQSSDDVIRVNTELTAFEVTVTDKKGNPVRGLKAEDFRVYENDAERKVDFFEPLKKQNDTRPLSIVFALDVSGSMTPEELKRLRDAMQIFVRNLADYESYFAVMTFGMEVKTLQSFTNRPEKLEKTFDKIMKDQDGLSTHAYDAVDDAVRLLRKKSPSAIKNQLPKRAVVLITDGFPVGDTVAPKTVIERANEAEASVYTVLLPSFSRLQGNRKPLMTPLEASGLTEKTGGRNFYATGSDFTALFRALAEEITASYVLAFYPNEEAQTDGKFRRVRIEARGDYTIKQNRDGYQLKRNEK